MVLIGNILQYFQKRSLTRYIGIALIIAFVLVTAMFVALYINSMQLQNQEYGSLQADPADPQGDLDQTQTGDQTGQVDQTGQADQAGQDDQTGQVDQVQQVEPERVAYLTFDDGPDRAITPGILDILLLEDIRATFFVLPYQGVDDLYQRIIDEGHEIGNHSFSHDYNRLYERDVSRFRTDIRRARDFIYDNFEYYTTSFRFPGGHQTAGRGLNARLDVIRELGYTHYHWHVDPDDWRTGRTAEEVRDSVKEQVNNNIRNGREQIIILLHDRYQKTLEALPGIIEDLRELGFEFDIVRNLP